MFSFYGAMLCIARTMLSPDVCPAVTHAGIVAKRLNVSLNLFHHGIATPSGRRWVFGPRGFNFGESLGDGSLPADVQGHGSPPAGCRGRAPGGGLGKPPEAEDSLQIVHVRKVFCVSRVVSKRALLFLYTNLYTKCRSINILRVYQCFMERGVIVKFSPRICIDLHGCP